MIDYEKLKLSFEMVEQLVKPAILTINVTHGDIGRVYGVLQYDYSLREVKHMGEFKFTCIEHLFKKLQSLVRPEPKYKVGDEVWILANNNVPIFLIIFENLFCKGSWSYTLHGDDRPLRWRPEHELFPTRQALIEHQCEYWQKLYNEGLDDHGVFNGSLIDEDTKCQHEYYGVIDDCIPKIKCARCGDFYK